METIRPEGWVTLCRAVFGNEDERSFCQFVLNNRSPAASDPLVLEDRLYSAAPTRNVSSSPGCG